MFIMGKEENSRIWFAVINGYAASKKAGTLWKAVDELLKEKGVTYHGTRTGKAGTAAELTFDACMAGYRRFVAVGGDGTVHDVLNGIAAYVEWTSEYPGSVSFSDFTLGVIPLGSGNDWIKSHGIQHDIEHAVEVLMKGNICPQDVVKVSLLDPAALPAEREISVSYMVNIGGVGLDAKVCERVNAKKKEGKRGRILYVTSLIHAIRHRVPSYAKVYCDGDQVFDGAYLSMAFGIGKYSGGGMRQTPAAVIDDGLLDMTLIPEIAMSRILVEAPRLFTGSFLKVPELTSCRGKVLTVIPYGDNAAEPVEIDGEVVGKAPVRFEVRPDRINVVTGIQI